MDGHPALTGYVSRLNTHFELDILASYECAQAMSRRAIFYPEEKLMFAVLTDAILCLQLHNDSESRRNQALFKRARAWIFDDRSDSLYSFESICEVLRIDPSYLRSGLKRWLTEQVSVRRRRRRLREPLRHPYRIRNQRVYA